MTNSNRTTTILAEIGAEPIDYYRVLKPRVMSLVVFSGLAGLIIAPGHLHPVLMVVTIIAIALGSGAAGAINMWYDRDIDAIMTRTSNRPIPSGRMRAGEALGFGITLSAVSVLLLAMAVNLLAASLLAAAILFYIFVYTIGLKRYTPQSIVIGGAAGAFPPMIGWAAVTGSLSLMPIFLFLLIFLWTPPHFWALSLYRSDDYDKAGVPMLPVVSGLAVTRWHIFVYNIILLPASLLPYWFGGAGWFYGTIALLMGTIFLATAVAILVQKNEIAAKRHFNFSLTYLAVLLLAVMVDHYLV